MLGAGTFGKVYRGLNVLTGELFAVKEIPAMGPCGDLSSGLDTLAREVDLMKALRHENIVRYLGTEREDGTLCVARCGACGSFAVCVCVCVCVCACVCVFGDVPPHRTIVVTLWQVCIP